MILAYEELQLKNKDNLREEILRLFERDIKQSKISFSSRNYTFVFAEGCFPAVLRLGVETSFRTVENVLCELMWVDDMTASVPTLCHPTPSLKNRLVERIELEEITYLVTQFRKANGDVLPAKYWNGSYFYRTGALLGQLHKASYHGEQVGFRYKRKQWDESPYFDFTAFDQLYEPGVTEAANRILNRIKKLPKDSRWFGMIHGDFQNGNLFSDWESLWVFDFDDCCYGYFMFDVACLLHMFAYSDAYAACHTQQTTEEIIYGADGIYTQVRAGYSSQWSLPDEVWDTLDDFFRLRMAQTMAMICDDKRIPDALRRGLTGFNVITFEEHIPPILRAKEVHEQVSKHVSSDMLASLKAGRTN